MKEDVLSFGNELTYKFKYIIINYIYGMPILLNDKVVGGYVLRLTKAKDNTDVVFFEGIEIEPEYRNKGIGRATVKMIKKQCDLIVGSITEDEPKQFWLKMESDFIDLPLEYFPKELLHTIHTKEPKMFYISNTPQGAKLKKEMIKDMPNLLEKMKNYKV